MSTTTYTNATLVMVFLIGAGFCYAYGAGTLESSHNGYRAGHFMLGLAAITAAWPYILGWV